MVHYYDRQGHPMEMMEWSMAFEDIKNRIVGKTEVDDNIHVSTVWLGIDHNFVNDGPPLIFETMIFGGPFSGYQWRYPTEDLARIGHEHIVADLLDGKEPT